MGLTPTGHQSSSSSTHPTHPNTAHDGMPGVPTHSCLHPRHSQHYGGCRFPIFHLSPLPTIFLVTLHPNLSAPTERILEYLPTTRGHDWTDLFHTVNQHVANGVVTATNKARDRYWREWRKFLRSDFDPHLQEMDAEQKISILQVFAERVRQGNHGRGSQVRAGTVQDALGHIGKTFELDGWTNPLYGHGTRTYHIRIARQLECYTRNDTPSQSQLAVPVAVANQCYSESRNGSAKTRATGELCLIAFFFLLRVGEYTVPNLNRTTRTQQFRLRDIAFFSATSSLTWEQACNGPAPPTIVRLKIDNQKHHQPSSD